NRAEGHFETANPINPERGWIRPDPRHKVRDAALRVPLIACKPVRLAERCQVLVSVQLPDDLWVADDGGVQVLDATPVPQWRPLPRDGIQPPVDRPPERQVRSPKQVKPPCQDSVRAI